MEMKNLVEEKNKTERQKMGHRNKKKTKTKQRSPGQIIENPERENREKEIK